MSSNNNPSPDQTTKCSRRDNRRQQLSRGIDSVHVVDMVPPDQQLNACDEHSQNSDSRCELLIVCRRSSAEWVCGGRGHHHRREEDAHVQEDVIPGDDIK